MAYIRAASAARPNRATLRDLFYKTDRPRWIDEYIDFFGDRAARSEPLADCCGDLLLGSLA
jgi:hypothetical protein